MARYCNEKNGQIKQIWNHLMPILVCSTIQTEQNLASNIIFRTLTDSLTLNYQDASQDTLQPSHAASGGAAAYLSVPLGYSAC